MGITTLTTNRWGNQVMYPRNAASPEPIAIGAVVQISDGAVQMSGCTVRIMPIGVAEGDGGGTTAYSTDGIVYYTPIQAETNYTSFILVAKKTGCIPVAITVVTTSSATPGTVLLAPVTHTSAVVPTVSTLTGHTAQTGDTYALANGAAGFVAIDTVVDAILDDTGTSGVLLSTTALGAIWNRLTSSMTTAGSIGKKLADWVVGTIDTYTGNTPQTGDSYARLGAPAGASVAADIAAVPTASQNAAAVEAAILNEGDATALLAAIAAKVEEFLINEGDATATIAAIATACNAAIVAGQVGTDAATAATQASSANTKLGTPAWASVSADIAAVKADTAAILLDTGTDGVVVATASKTGYALSSAGVRSIWTDDWFEITFLNTTPGGYLQALDTANDTTSASLSAIDLWVKRNAVILSGIVTGAGTGTEVFTISTLSITATVTVDGDGNRSALVWS